MEHRLIGSAAQKVPGSIILAVNGGYATSGPVLGLCVAPFVGGPKQDPFDHPPAQKGAKHQPSASHSPGHGAGEGGGTRPLKIRRGGREPSSRMWFKHRLFSDDWTPTFARERRSLTSLVFKFPSMS